MAATAVPHEPAPITATLVGIAITVVGPLQPSSARVPTLLAVDELAGPVAVLVPVKAFSEAKRRLAPALAPADRAALARSMATTVVLAARPLPVAVVCDDAEVAEWASEQGAIVVLSPGRGLNTAVEDGADALAARGARQGIVAHADLPRASSLAWVARFPGVPLVPDRHDDGTNVACIPAASGFRFSYGPASFRRHCAEARRIGLSLRVVRDPVLGFDVDLPADLTATPAFL